MRTSANELAVSEQDVVEMNWRMARDVSLLKIQFGAIEGGDKQRAASPTLMRLVVHSDDAGRRPPGRQ